MRGIAKEPKQDFKGKGEIISYATGGYKWKVRYMDNKGYIITAAGGEPGNNQYNLMTGVWSDYDPTS